MDLRRASRALLLRAAWALRLVAPATAQAEMAAHQLSPSAWSVQGESALGSSANRNFVPTPASS